MRVYQILVSDHFDDISQIWWQLNFDLHFLHIQLDLWT